MMDWRNCIYKEDSFCKKGTVDILNCPTCEYRFDDEDMEENNK